MQRKRIVLLGRQGSGKTTLFNKITGHKKPTSFVGGSLTKKIVSGQSQHGIGFEVIDTPGFESDEEKILHAAGIVAGLSYGQLNRIIIVVKVGRDFEIKIIQRIYDCVKRFQENITIYFTCLDNVPKEQRNNDQNLLIDYVKKNFKIQSVLFGTSDDLPICIIDKLDKILETSNFVHVQLSELEQFKTYDFVMFNDEQQKNMEMYKAKLTTKFKKYSSIFSGFIDNLNENEKFYLEILQKFQFFIKEQADKVLEDFEKEFGEYLNNNFQINSQNNQYLHHIMLSYSINQDVLQLISKIYSKMSKNKNSIFQYLKQCPYCDEIWMKVYGCDKVTCGRQVGVSYDSIFQMDLRPEIVFKFTNDGQLIHEIIQQHPIKNKTEFLYIFEQYFKSLPYEVKIKHSLKKFSDLTDLLKKLIQPDFLDDWNENLDFQKKDEFFKSLTEMLQNYEVVSELKLKTDNKLGCGKKFSWEKQGKLVSREKCSSLLSEGVYDFFKDQQELKKQEFILWQNDLQNEFNEEINRQTQSIEQLSQLKMQQSQSICPIF